MPSKLTAKRNVALAALVLTLIVLPACSINVKDKGKEGEKRVDIQTPMGDIHVNEQPGARGRAPRPKTMATIRKRPTSTSTDQASH